MKLVIDTNIVFSAILNPSKGVGKIFQSSQKYFDLYTCEYLRSEIHNNREKIRKISKLQPNEFDDLLDYLLQNMTVLHEDIIPLKFRKEAEELTRDVDEYDSPFLALALYLRCRLWTGDKILVKGLLKKKCYVPILTPELLAMLQ